MTTDNDETRRLREVLQEKNEILRSHQHELDEALAQIRKSFDLKIAEAKINIEETNYELQSAIAAQAKIDNANMPTHLLYEWKRPAKAWEGKAYKLSGRVGRYEIRSPDSKFRGHPWGVSTGDKFIRVLNKDGTSSLSWECCDSTRTKWLPEGETP